MLNRKLLLGVATVWLSSIALANGGAPTVTPEVVPAPMMAPAGGLFLGAELLYWQPNNHKLSYGIIDANIIDPDPIGTIAQIKPSHEFGFSVKGGYHCPNTDMDLTVAYTRLRADDNQLYQGSPGAAAPAVIEGIWARLAHPAATDRFESASAYVDFEYDAFDLMFGKTMRPNHFDFRVAAGVRYAEVNSKFDVYYDRSVGWPRAVGEPSEKADVNLKSDYHGIGPRVEVDGLYQFGAGIGLEASAGTTLLVGRGKLHEYQSYTGTFNTNDVLGNRTNRVVPELDAKLGLNYTCCLPRSYKFSISAGWQVVNYFNVRETLRFLELENEGVYSHFVSDVSFNGPYAGLLIMAS